MTKKQLVLIGSYTEPVAHAAHAAGPGIITVAVNGDKLTEVCRTGVSIAGANPSYICNEGEDVYAANEIANGTITRLRVDQSGGLTFVQRLECGQEPCHVCIAENGVLGACFGDGSVWSYIHDRGTGTLRVADRWVCETRGAHQALALGEKVLVCNPVAGVVHLLRRDGGGGLRGMKRLALGGYPRHAVAGDGVVHVALAKARAVATVAVEEFAEVGRRGLGAGVGVLGAIRRTADAVMVSERGHANNRIWRVAQDVSWCWSGGDTPRDFDVCGDALVAVHQACGRVASGEFGSLRAVDLAGEHAALVSVCFLS